MRYCFCVNCASIKYLERWLYFVVLATSNFCKLQCVAVFCSVLQCVAVCCSVLQAHIRMCVLCVLNVCVWACMFSTLVCVCACVHVCVSVYCVCVFGHCVRVGVGHWHICWRTNWCAYMDVPLTHHQVQLNFITDLPSTLHPVKMSLKCPWLIIDLTLDMSLMCP